MLVTIITPTGDRKLCMERLIYYINRQTYNGPLQWVIGDDSAEPTFYDSKKVHPCVQHGKYEISKPYSFTGNILRIIPAIVGDIVIIMEDDDWYSADYIEKTLERLDGPQEIVGEPEAVYYNVKNNSYRINGNKHRSSFCETAFKKSLIPKLAKYCEKNRHSAFVDDRLWRHVRENNVPYKMFSDRRLCIGIKGMPGRKGIGIGHRPGRSFQKDPEWKMLIKLIGKEDAQYYIDLKKNGVI